VGLNSASQDKTASTTAAAAYVSGVDLLVLGPVVVRNHGEPVPIGGPKQRAILALLTAEVGHPVSLDRIVDDVYGEDAPEGARRSVQTFVSMIRRELGEIVRPTAGGYVLVADPQAIDAVRFEEQIRTVMPLVDTNPEMASTSLRDALAMWRGHPYADVDSRSILQPEIIRLTDLRLAALEARIDADLALGRHRELTGELEALIVEHPLREKLRAQHMLALYRCGRQTEALRAFERARLYLAEEIGVGPSPDLSGLEQRILEQDRTLDLPAAASVTQRAVLALDAAGPQMPRWARPDGRDALTESLARIHSMVTAHDADTVTQRGSAIYASFPTVEQAIDTVEDIIPAATNGASPRASIDFGDVELHESEDIGGPPVRRSAGMVAMCHPGQVVISSEANQALMAGGRSGLTVRSLGMHRIHGVESPQQIFQLVMAGQDDDFPALLVDAYPPPLPFDRRAVPGYELRQPISSDLVGTTYRAYQPSAGREVELTVIDPAWSAEPEFVSRFEVETQLVSRLHHPHVVPLLDYWRDPSGAYLVGFSVGGKTLTERMADHRLEPEDVRRLVSQIGEALAHAHEMGLAHGAISPGTVVIDDSGNGYLPAAGFILRLVAVPATAGVSTSFGPRDGASSPLESDVHGLGLLAESLLADASSDESAVATKLRTVAERATAQLDADRFASMGDFLAAWNEGSGREQTRSGPSPLRNPYKGLSAFEEADSGDFFGRSASVTELIEMLAERKLVAVVGPSGSGKSSLVHAGLVPAVREGALGEPGQWLVADMFPGSYPLEELESALGRVAVEDPGALVDELGSDDRGLTRVIKRILPAGTRLLLVIDQFEELFTITREEEARNRLLQGLVDLVADERSDTRVVLTLRADFFDRPLEYPEFGELMKAGIFALTAPVADQLLEVIERPAREVGATWESGLPQTILDDVAASPGMLPLLQYALTELFVERRGNELTHAAYRASGGVVGALSSRADEVYAQLDSSDRDLARQIFLHLVTPEPTGEVTRRRPRLLELNALGEPGMVKRILDAFGEARLLVFDRDPISRSPTVEVAHEALLTRWPLLVDWIDEAGEDLLLHRRLQDAVDEWEGRDREGEYLLTGGRLAQFETWADSTDLVLGPSETDYLDASSTAADQQRSRRRRIRNTVTAGFGVAALVAGLFAVSAVRSSEVARSRELGASAINVLDEDPELSVLLALQAAGISDPPFESVSALHESLALHYKVFTYQWPSGQEVVDLSARISPDGNLIAANSGGSYIEVTNTTSDERLWSHTFAEEAIVRIAFSPDGSSLVATVGWYPGPEGSEPSPTLKAELGAHRFDARTGQQLDHVPVGGCGIVTSPAMLQVIGAGSGSHLIIEKAWDECSYRSGRGEEVSLGQYPMMALFEMSTGEVDLVSAWPSGMYATPDGTRLLVRGPDVDGEPSSKVIDRLTGTQLAIVSGIPGAISSDGSVVLTMLGVFESTKLATWDITDGQPTEPLTLVDGPLALSLREINAWLSPGGDAVARVVGSSVELTDARSGELEAVMYTGLGSNERLSFSQDGNRLLIGEVFGGTAVVFDRRIPSELGSVDLCDRIGIQTGSVRARGDTISVYATCDNSGSLGTQFLIDSDSLEVRASVIEQSGNSTLSEDGRLVANQLGRLSNRLGEFVAPAGDEMALVSQLVLRDSSTGEVVRTLDGLCEWEDGGEWGPDCVEFPGTPYPDWPWHLAFSPDGSHLAVAGQYTDAVVVWDTASGQIVGRAEVEHNTDAPNQVLDVVFSPGGDRIAASFVWAPKELWMIETDDWQPISQYLAPDGAETIEAPSDNLTFTPDGETLIGTDFSIFGAGHIVLMDGTTLEHLAEIKGAHEGGVIDLALDEEGSRLASVGRDGVVRLWDLGSKNLIHEIPVSQVGDGLGGVDFVDDGRHLLVTAMDTGDLHKVTTDTEELLDIALDRVTRGLTETECSTYRIDPCPTLEEMRAAASDD
jgi:DNA-binding SARP family transcriptional activator/WD40 repeat protein